MNSAVLAPHWDISKYPEVSILIPTYGAAAQLRTCLESLARFAPPGTHVCVLDDATPDSSIRETCEEIASSVSQLDYVRSEVNRGFVGTCNWGCEYIRERESDVLLLNSDTEVTAGFLEEMRAVLHLHEKHGVVSPRSNNATIFSIPPRDARFTAAESYSTWQQIRHLLPRYQIMPTAVGFCMLIKAEILKRFRLFDEIYAPGYNEENDFVCRINGHGYSAVAANWAYVFHHESSSFGSRKAKLEETNRKTLLFRYPEYGRKVSDYERFHKDPVERFAALYKPHRPRILYDLTHLADRHTGTSEVGLNLLRELAKVVEGEFDLFVGTRPAERFFARELAGYQIYEDRPDSQMVFDLAFKPAQIFSWADLRRLDRLAPRVSFCLLDIIAVRCDYLNSPWLQVLLQKTAELSDCVFTISAFSRADFAAFYGEDVPMRVIYLATNLGMTAGEFRTGDYVLVVGNHFVHKGIQDALRHLDAEWPVVVLGGKKESAPANVRWLASGNLTRQHIRELFAGARVLVYPSHYEGFGLPIIDALALGKPVVVLDTAVNRELAAVFGDSGLYRISSLQDLHSTVAKLLEMQWTRPVNKPRRWCDVAEDYAEEFRKLLGRELDTTRMRARWEMLRIVGSLDGAKTAN